MRKLVCILFHKKRWTESDEDPDEGGMTVTIAVTAERA